MARLNLLEETRFEKIPITVYPNETVASKKIAGRIADLIKAKEASGETTVLGLPNGATPLGVYEELMRMHKEEGLSFKNVIAFNLYEYYPMEPTAEQSCVHFMNEQLFNHVDISEENIHIPDGTLDKEDISGYCLHYENKIEELGGLDLQILGIGRNGHIGFNEPGSAPNSGARYVTLDDLTRHDALGILEERRTFLPKPSQWE